ncbi:uncharacterized protein LOC126691242 [Quercus robur]|uniref:uncharacterized protein LOC126691242 n=1 Tax=Quercus robur TaxID=38942 RepID=UPI0021634AB5|nr:uncharacterized protein LOC126691242 [Quercus robur]
MIDQGSAADIMYPNLYKGLGLRPENLAAYSSLLVSFEGRMVVPKGQIKLPVQTDMDVVEVDFIVVDVFSPYTAIIGRPWLHTLGAVSSTLHQKEKERLLQFLRENVNVFAWSPYEAPGIDPSFICHRLNVNPTIIPKRQPPRGPSKEHAETVRSEVAKLKQAGAIKEVLYPQWLANTVVVKKKTGKWRVCVDFTDLNKACPKDPFPMPKIDQLVDAILGRNIEVYIDDMIVKSKVVFEHVEDLTSIYGILTKHKLRLNASKCSFGVGSGRSAERCHPFFLLLHKWKGFEWTEECAAAFQQLKEFLSRPPIMSSPEVDEVQFAYLAVASHAVSFVLIREDSGVQRLVYYVSKSLHEAEVRYLPLENAILAVVHATHKLPHYFQAHTIVVLTQLPLKSILRSVDYTRRIAKWGTVLDAFDIKYMPRTSVKGQVLADLVAEFAECPEEADMKQSGMDEKSVGLISTQGASSWRVYVDGAANQRGAGLGLVLISPEEIIIEKSLRLGFLATNNEAEYETLLMGMSMVQKMGGKVVELFSDSRLIVGQVKGELEA